MRLLSYFRSPFAKLFRRSQIDNDMEQELRSHIAHRADDLERSGLSRIEAERRARIEFGGQERIKQESYRALGGNFIEVLIHDVRYSSRVLRKSPAFAVAAILTLALAIGANAVVFGVLNALILRPLNLPHEESLYGIDRGGIGFTSYPDYVDLRDRNHSFEELALFNVNAAVLDAGKDLSRSWYFTTSGNYFDIVGIQPYLGRFYHRSDEHGNNSAQYIVLSYAYWHSHLQDDRGVIGRAVLLGKEPFTIIGVAPPEFHGTTIFFAPDFYVPILAQTKIDGAAYLEKRTERSLFDEIGHLKPGVTPGQAVADLNSIGAALEKEYPKEETHAAFSLARPLMGTDFLGSPVRAFVAGIMLLAILILLAACANLGSLFGARAADRSREVALRLALGSSRTRIVRQLLTEAILISLGGGAVGLWGSIILLQRLSAWQPFARFPMRIPVSPDARVLLVALTLALVSGILFGIVPVRQVLRTDPYEIVKAGSTVAVGRRLTIRDALLVMQIAICGVLVTSSMVALRGLVRSVHANFGIEPQNAMLVEADMTGYKGEAATAIRKRMLARIQTIPGVQSAAIIDLPPLTYETNDTVVFADKTTDFRPINAAARPLEYSASPGYFATAGTTLLTGRDFTWHDDAHAPRVSVINQEFARQVFGSTEKAMGAYFKLRDGSRVQVVGVVEDGKYFQLSEAQQPVMFFPILQTTATETWLVVRSPTDPEQLAAAIRSNMREIDSGMFPYIQPWTSAMDAVMFGPRMATISLGILGLMGAMLSVTGIFGMAAYSVSKRMRELGIRMALGAQRNDVLKAALGRAFKLLAWGSSAGLLLGILASRVLAFIVYEANPRDPLVLTGVVLAMALLGLAAAWIPAQRALSVNPLILLREE